MVASSFEHSIFGGEAQHAPGPSPTRSHHDECTENSELTNWRCVGAPAIADGQSGGRHAEGNEQYESPSKPDSGLSRSNVFTIRDVVAPVLGKIGKATIDSGSTKFVCDEQRFASRIACWIGELMAQNAKRLFEVGCQHPFTLRCMKCGTHDLGAGCTNFE